MTLILRQKKGQCLDNFAVAFCVFFNFSFYANTRTVRLIFLYELFTLRFLFCTYFYHVVLKLHHIMT